MNEFRIDAEKFANLPSTIKGRFIKTIKQFSQSSGFDLDFKYLWFTITDDDLLLLTLQEPAIKTYFRRKN